MAKEPRNPLCRFSSEGLVSASRQEVLFQVTEWQKEPRNPLCRFSSEGLVSASRQEVLFQVIEWQRSRGIHFAGSVLIWRRSQGIGERIAPGSVVPGDLASGEESSFSRGLVSASRQEVLFQVSFRGKQVQFPRDCERITPGSVVPGD